MAFPRPGTGSRLPLIALGLVASVEVCAGTITVGKTGAAYTTIQAGINAAQSGDTVSVAPGVYGELVKVNKAITVQGTPGAIVDGTGLSTSGQGLVVLSASGSSFKGFEVRNFATTSSGNVPVGIRIASGISHITVQGNLVHHITTSEATDSHNAHGIAVYGESATANTDINILDNEIHSCKLGQSETLVINGNVNGWVVSGNYIHDNDNIGIDAIGFEGVGPAGSDQARNGRITGNVVRNISSAANPTYGGERSADGIYVDGGASILIEGNRVDACDVGIELASEHLGKNTSDITVRSNFVSRSYQANILMGGYDSKRGNAVNIAVLNNTTYQGGGGEVALQFHCSAVTIKNNILWAKSAQEYLQEWGSGNSGVTAAHNLYYGASTSSPGAWSDAFGRYVNPRLVNTYLDMHLQASSPAIDAGADLAGAAGTADIDGQARIQGSAIDLGADEYTSAVATYTLSASAGTGGTISPSGAVTAVRGASQTFAIAASTGYRISDVNVDGASVGAVSSYTFSDVQASHTISAAFAAIPAIRITTQPVSTAAKVGQTAAFSVGATSTAGPIAYQWYRKPASVATYSAILGATAATCTTGVLALDDNASYYFVRMTSGGITQDSARVPLKVTPVVTITTQVASRAAKIGQTATFTVGATANAGILSYQWYRKPASATTYLAIAGATAASFTTPILSAADNGSLYFVRISDSGTVVDSARVPLVVTPVVTITIQPVAKTVTAGQSATFTVGATANGGTIAYQWYRRAPGAAVYTAISGATGASFTTPVLMAEESGAYYFVRLTDAGTVADSVRVPLTVTP